MALNKKFNEVDFKKFEQDLLFVLKREPSHKLDFDGKMLFKSRRYGCLLVATDVFWDEKTGDIVLVGAHKGGAPVIDESKGFPEFKQRVAVPLRECFDDLKESSGMEMRLLSKARKAVIDKYVGEKLNVFTSRSLMRDGVLDLKGLGIGKFVKQRADGQPTDLSSIDAVLRGEDGMTALLCSNSFSDGYEWSMSKIPLADIQLFGSELERVNVAYSKVSDIFTSKMQELERKDMSYTPQETRRHRDMALVAVYDSGASLDLCNAVATTYAASNIFDRHAHSQKDIEAAVKNFRTSGRLAIRQNGGPSIQP